MWFAAGFFDEEFVFRGTAGVLSRLDDQLAVGPSGGFAGCDRVFDQLGIVRFSDDLRL